jgi:hypothetical protein
MDFNIKIELGLSTAFANLLVSLIGRLPVPSADAASLENSWSVLKAQVAADVTAHETPKEAIVTRPKPVPARPTLEAPVTAAPIAGAVTGTLPAVANIQPIAANWVSIMRWAVGNKVNTIDGTDDEVLDRVNLARDAAMLPRFICDDEQDIAA